MSKVSVIIPNYNHAKYLSQRIESVLNQSFTDLEVIILDDCSTDKSQEIIGGYENHPLVSHIVVNKKNSGSVFKQWKRGLELAQGKYIWIAESDDYADASFLATMVSFIETDSSFGFVYCNGNVLVDEQISAKTFADIRNEAYRTTKWSDDYVNEGTDEIRANLMINCTVNNASGVLFRRNALIDVEPFDRDFKYVGDWYCYLKICSKYKMGYVNKALNFYRDHPVNASKKLQQNLQFINEYFQVYDWALDNVTTLNRREIQKLFLAHIDHSLLIGFRKHLPLYRKLLLQNPQLFSVMFKHNMKNHLRRLADRLGAKR